MTGVIPAEIGNFPELISLQLFFNKISGTLPIELGNLTELTELDVSGNRFSGTIPEELGNLVKMEYLWLGGCGLSGSIPQSFQNLTYLIFLDLKGDYNYIDWLPSKFSGDFPDLTNLPLTNLYINYNYFSFSDFSDEFSQYISNIEYFEYSPQLVDNPEDIIFSPGDDITLTMTDAPIPFAPGIQNSSPNTYQWFKDNQYIPGATSLNYTIDNAQESDAGVYVAQIYNAAVPDFVLQRLEITLSKSLSIDDNILEKMKIYPNPVSSTLIFNIKENGKSYKVSIYDISGKLVKTEKLSALRNPNIDVSNLESGVYMIKVISENFTISRKIIKE